jgi:hypothetical protein
MRLDRNAKIGGMPALEVRQLLRRFGEGPRDVPEVMAALGVDWHEAHRVVNLLYRLGYVEGDFEAGQELRWRRTPMGDRVAAATVTRPLSRARADRVLQAFLRRVAEVNRRPYFRCRVSAVGVFGEYLTEVSIIEELDLVVQLVPKPPRPGDSPGGRPRSRLPYWRLRKVLELDQWPDWEKLHVELFLLSSPPMVVLHRPDDPILRGQRIRIVYLEHPDAEAPVPQRPDDSA